MNKISNYDLVFQTRDYEIISEQCYHPDLGTYHTYGIQLLNNEETLILHDVSVDLNTVLKITEIINRNSLSPIHLREVIEDFIS